MASERRAIPAILRAVPARQAFGRSTRTGLVSCSGSRFLVCAMLLGRMGIMVTTAATAATAVAVAVAAPRDLE
jgi:hypothetical protein